MNRRNDQTPSTRQAPSVPPVPPAVVPPVPVVSWVEQGSVNGTPSGAGRSTMEIYGNFEGICCRFMRILHCLGW